MTSAMAKETLNPSIDIPILFSSRPSAKKYHFIVDACYHLSPGSETKVEGLQNIIRRRLKSIGTSAPLAPDERFIISFWEVRWVYSF